MRPAGDADGASATPQTQCARCGTVAAAGHCPACGEPTPPPVPGAAAVPETATVHETAVVPGPSTRPAPRVDPYTQYGNPLNDTWGTTTAAAPPVAPQAPPPATAPRPRRSWRTRTTVLVALLALAAAGWFGRTWLVERWDSIYEWVEDRTGAEDEAASTFGAGLSESGLPSVSSVAYVDDEANRAFLDWEQANAEELRRRLGALGTATWATIDPEGSATNVSATLAELETSARSVVELLDTAPESQLRTASVTSFLKMVQLFDLLERALGGDPATFSEEMAATSEEMALTLARYSEVLSHSEVLG